MLARIPLEKQPYLGNQISYRLQVWIILLLIKWRFVGAIVCFSGKCSRQILKLYVTKNDGKNNDSSVFEVLVCPAEDC